MTVWHFEPAGNIANCYAKCCFRLLQPWPLEENTLQNDTSLALCSLYAVPRQATSLAFRFNFRHECASRKACLLGRSRRIWAWHGRGMGAAARNLVPSALFLRAHETQKCGIDVWIQ